MWSAGLKSAVKTARATLLRLGLCWRACSVRQRRPRIPGTDRLAALLRAVNVGGTGKLPMAGLKVLCTRAGFAEVETYIASGNVVFAWGDGEVAAKAALEAALAEYAGRPVPVFIRSADEMRAVVAANPFSDREGRLVGSVFLDAPPPGDAAAGAKNRDGEETALGTREICVCYPNGMGRSKLRLPAAAYGTARNMNTV